jgi:addiction module HigA family antidote
MEMFNPPHPGEILWELYMEPEEISIQEAAYLLDVDRKTVSRLINKHTSVSAEMAVRLAKSFSTSEKLWLGLQDSYDIWKVKQEHRVDLKCVKKYEYKEL